MLDADPTNELGKGLIASDLETWLLANGYVYAHRCSGGTMVASKRPMKEAIADIAHSLTPPVPTRIRRATRTVVHP